MRRWPERLVVIADSACAFNPTYGQGVTVAAQTAEVLGERLADHGLAHRSLDGFARGMQRAVARCGRAAWTIATGEDLRLPTTTGAKANALVRRQHRYFDRVMEAATRDQVVQDAVTDVLFLLSRPESLFRPSMIARVLRHSRVPGPGSAPLGAQPGPRTPTRV